MDYIKGAIFKRVITALVMVFLVNAGQLQAMQTEAMQPVNRKWLGIGVVIGGAIGVAASYAVYRMAQPRKPHDMAEERAVADDSSSEEEVETDSSDDGGSRFQRANDVRRSLRDQVNALSDDCEQKQLLQRALAKIDCVTRERDEARCALFLMTERKKAVEQKYARLYETCSEINVTHKRISANIKACQANSLLERKQRAMAEGQDDGTTQSTSGNDSLV